MNSKTVISLFVAIALGLAAMWVGRGLIFNQPTIGGSTSAAMTQVVVAKHDLEPGQTVVPEDFAMMEMPTAGLPSTVFTDPKILKDRALVSAVVKGQMMFENLLAPTGSEGGLGALVPKGMRAVSLEVNEYSGVSGLLVPGSRVDVIATLRTDNGNATMAKTIVENAKVQAVGPRFVRSKGNDREPAAKTVTLIVTTKDAEAIELASNSGRPRLVLRGMSDTDRTASVGVTSAELTGPTAQPEVRPAATQPSQASAFDKFLAAMASHGSVAAVPAPPVRWPVQIIRGNNESTIYYEFLPKAGGNSGSTSSSAGSAGNSAPVAATTRAPPTPTSPDHASDAPQDH